MAKPPHGSPHAARPTTIKRLAEVTILRASAFVRPVGVSPCWPRRVIRRDHASRWLEARRGGVDAENKRHHALDFLMPIHNSSRIVAVRFQDEDRAFQPAAKEGRRTAPPMIEPGHLLSASHAVQTFQEGKSYFKRCTRRSAADSNDQTAVANNVPVTIIDRQIDRVAGLENAFPPIRKVGLG